MAKKGPRKRVRRLMGYAITILMNLIVLPLIFLWTFVAFLSAFPTLFVLNILTGLPKGVITRKLVWLYGRGWLMLMSLFVRFEKSDLEKNAASPPCIIVTNHQSFFDVYCMALLPISDIVFAIRAWPFKMFWYLPFMRLARYIDLETLGWHRCAQEAKNLLAGGAVILFFPEGHRSVDGKLQRFYSGAFKLSIETQTKIVPVCICGTMELLPRGRWWVKPGKVTLQALEPVDPKPYTGPLAHRELSRHVKGMMARCLEEMARPGRKQLVMEPSCYGPYSLPDKCHK